MIEDQTPSRSAEAAGTDRRAFLRRAGLLSGGLVAGAALGATGERLRPDARTTTASAPPAELNDPTASAAPTAPATFYGAHQAGVIDTAPSQLRFLALDLHPATVAGGKGSLAAMLRRLSDAASAQVAGHWIAEQGTTLEGSAPAGLTVTIGFGARLIEAAGVPVPAALTPIPAFAGDMLQPARSGGDLAIQVCGDDELVVSSVARSLTLVLASWAAPRWLQGGFLPGAGSRDLSATPRNLMGQLDGTDNPTGTRLDLAVWQSPQVTPSWMGDGTFLVCRRIQMLLPRWEKLASARREAVIGRTLTSGAPLSGGEEHTVPDFSATAPDGSLLIPRDAHVRLTHPANNTGAVMLRRGYSYDDGLATDGAPDAGLFFQAFQTDPRQVFVPIQRKLAAADALSPFIRHTASALFAVPPGASAGGYVGETLLA